ncbi:MAG: hypothetical protein COU81_01225 [Candidatus Portnoybacteria bacterium CG10_big_fil_rev_8_21_14_0_10_36_7]|uniref:Uncharacterized protein n=1 Tax=Candidatus Portnoybacteria bacterium CG10_big_fil_rev_8_21_14_0_10_36_7 TaxID=1974812 RepID=A0A2M8KEN8_9BACT|nr:MAG: hypothetical protein COU81_01225 [Candidatus Portnoybacteria bacterium CG10_big_fil_rev_8_21_14_0_10_36_7]
MQKDWIFKAVKDLLEEWKSSRDLRGEVSFKNFKFQYKSRSRKQSIAEALAFWRWIIEERWFASEIRQELLNHFSQSSDELIRLVVQIESMPTILWRKILVKYNINSTSLESFLRRITQDQIKSFEYNFDDFMSGRISRAFSWWDRIVKKNNYGIAEGRGEIDSLAINFFVRKALCSKRFVVI